LTVICVVLAFYPHSECVWCLYAHFPLAFYTVVCFDKTHNCTYLLLCVCLPLHLHWS